jgi:hypothetical protein
MDLLHSLLALLSGAIVGFTLGLIGGGGSIMATPLLLYVVGLQPHMAIGTGALAVSVNAFANFGGHARAGNVRWRCAVIFAVIGIAGAALGSMLGKQIDGKQLLFLFAILMIVVGVLMLRRKDKGTPAAGAISPASTRNVCQLWNPKTRNPLPVASAALGVGRIVRLLWDRRRVPDRTGPPVLDGHADDLRHRLLAAGGWRLRPDHRHQLWNVRFDRLAGGRRIFGWRSRRRIGGHGARHQPGTAQGSVESRFRQPRLHRRGLHALPQRCGARPMITKPFRRVREKWCGVLAGKTDAGHQRGGQ